jgi:hypothetical protein
VSPVKYELGLYIPKDGIRHRHRRESLKSYIALIGWALQRRRNVLPVKYELGFYIPKDGILHSHRRDNLRSYMIVVLSQGVGQYQYLLAEEELLNMSACSVTDLRSLVGTWDICFCGFLLKSDLQVTQPSPMHCKHFPRRLRHPALWPYSKGRCS